MSLTATIHQPQYLPWAAYFDKILRSDVFVILDHVQFQKNGLQNRNKIKTQQGDLWLTIPVKQHLGTPISQTLIADPKALPKHYKTLELSYRKASEFSAVMTWLAPILMGGATNLSVVCSAIIEETLKYLGFQGRIVYSSALEIEGKASDLVLEICKKLGCSMYLSGQGGKSYLKLEDFAASSIKVEFQNFKMPEYPQQHAGGFIPDLALVDALFNVPVSGVLDLIQRGRQV